MLKKFDSASIEKKWQKKWAGSDIYKTDIRSEKPKAYVLDMFPYPSGEGLHVGHPKGYIATDVYSRFKKMTGFEVLHPMGWDAFGLPAENFAIKNKIHPRVAVEKNIANFKAQLAELGFNYDWDKEINTTDPEFVKWTQWIFLRLLEKGLAFESHEPINWCPSCQTGLANEDLESDGTCERCGSVVEKKPMRQWVLKITDYADRMLADLDTLNWPEHIKEAQRNWIGRSEGAEIDFVLSNGVKITAFTTRPDTLFGATFLVLAPEHPLIEKAREQISNQKEVDAYVKKSKEKEEKDRLDATKEKTGVKLEGITATNPANGDVIPVFIADYVLGGYGTGALMAVPAHDERDFAFAEKFGIPKKQTVAPFSAGTGEYTPKSDHEIVHTRAASAVIKHWSEDLYYVVHFSTTDDGFVGGKLESSENAEDAIRREVTEESGYNDFKKVVGMCDHVFGRVYKPRKMKEELCDDSLFFLELASDSRLKIADKETKNGSWVSMKELVENKKFSNNHKLLLELYLKNGLYTGSGLLVNSDEFTGMESEEAKVKIVEKVGGRMTSTYRLKDWVFSRQRYWGEPIPVVHCRKCGVVAVPDSELPVRLPEVENYAPTGTGESPLANIADWVNTTCPKCGGVAKRETNTMPQWAGSSWYYLRFADPENEVALIDQDVEKKWLPVDVYVGGDHAVRHLIYARFWHKFLYDIGVVHTLEPFTRLEFLGFILAEDGRKMSKRWGNIINPSDIVKTNGADALRVYEMFMGPFENTIAWSKDGIVGSQRFLERVNGLSEHIVEKESDEMTRVLHKTIKKVRSDIEAFKFNTAISAMMIYLNNAEKQGLTKSSYKTFIQLLAPFAPHLSEELWEGLDGKDSVHISAFPQPDEALTHESVITLAVQINGKMRGTLAIEKDANEKQVKEAVWNDPQFTKYIADEVQKVIYVPGKIVNFIVKA